MLVVIHKENKTQLIPLLLSPPFPSSFLPVVLLFHESTCLAGQLTPFQDDSSAVLPHFSAAHTGLVPRKNYFFRWKKPKILNKHGIYLMPSKKPISY